MLTWWALFSRPRISETRFKAVYHARAESRLFYVPRGMATAASSRRLSLHSTPLSGVGSCCRHAPLSLSLASKPLPLLTTHLALFAGKYRRRRLVASVVAALVARLVDPDNVNDLSIISSMVKPMALGDGANHNGMAEIFAQAPRGGEH